jgi:putative ABC transport system permease protein
MLLTACGLLMQSGLSSGIGPQRLAGADVVVAAHPVRGGEEESDDETSGELVPMRADTIEKVASVPGVRQAVADLSVAVNVVGPDGELVGATEAGGPQGHGWSSARLGPLALAEGQAPSSANEVVLDRELATKAGAKLGTEIRLATGSTPRTFRLVGLVDPPRSVGALRQAAVFFTDAEAAELSGRPRDVNAIAVLAAPGVDPTVLASAIEDRLGRPFRTFSGASIGRVEFADARATSELLVGIAGSFGGIAAMTAMFVVASTLGLAMQQRRREFALLRAIAATPRQVHRMIGAEILLVAVAAAIPGAILGLGLVWLLRAGLGALGVVPSDYELSIGPVPVLVAMAITVVTARLAGWLSARRAIRIRPVEALGESAVERARLGVWRTLIGLIFLAGGLTMAMLPFWVSGESATALAVMSVLVLVIAVALLGPPIVMAAIVLLSPFVRMFSVGGYLAAKNTRANSRRLASAVTPLVLAIGLLVVQASVGTAQLAEVERQVDDGLVADFVLASEGTGISPELVDEVSATAGVATATAVVRGETVLRYEEVDAMMSQPYATQGVDPAQLADTMDLQVRSGSTDVLRGHTVALSSTAADAANVEVGGKAEVFLADGTRITPTVVAIYGRGMGFGDVLLPRSVLLEHALVRLDTMVLVRAAPGVDKAALASSLGTLAGEHLGVRLSDREALVAAERQAVELNNLVNVLLLVGLFGYIAVNVVNTLVMATSDRRREFALLRLVGTTAAQVKRTMRIESFVVVFIAIALGTMLTVLPLIGVRLGLSEGATATPVLSMPTYLLTIAGTAVLGVLSIMIPTRSALRGKPVDTIGIRD